MKHLLSIIIVNWNTSEHLRKCLQTIYQSDHDFSFEVIVIDNHSKDHSANMVKSEFSYVNLIENETNRGFAAANNQGINIATGKYILLLNPDTLLMKNTLQNSLEVAENNLDAGVVGCQVLENKNTIQNTCFSFPSPLNLFLGVSGLDKMFPKSRFFGKPHISWWERKSERYVDVVSGMFMLVRKEALNEVGLMDESYFIYAEEADWCYRFWASGWSCLFTPDAKVIHTDGGGKSTSLIAVKMYVQLQKSLLIFNLKNMGITSWLLAKALFIFHNLIRSLIWTPISIIVQNDKTIFKRNCAIAGLRFLLTGKEPSFPK